MTSSKPLPNLKMATLSPNFSMVTAITVITIATTIAATVEPTTAQQGMEHLYFWELSRHLWREAECHGCFRIWCPRLGSSPALFAGSISANKSVKARLTSLGSCFWFSRPTRVFMKSLLQTCTCMALPHLSMDRSRMLRDRKTTFGCRVWILFLRIFTASLHLY